MASVRRLRQTYVAELFVLVVGAPEVLGPVCREPPHRDVPSGGGLRSPGNRERNAIVNGRDFEASTPDGAVLVWSRMGGS